eukprot:12215502-Karenia_brevis.AAC.1
MLVIAGDFQLELPKNFEGYTGPSALGRQSSSDYWDRADLLMKLMRRFKLCACNTWAAKPDEPVQTRIPWGKTNQEDGTQIDYILASKGLACTSGVSSTRIFRSDHLAVWAKFTLMPGQLRSRPRKTCTR